MSRNLRPCASSHAGADSNEVRQATCLLCSTNQAGHNHSALGDGSSWTALGWRVQRLTSMSSISMSDKRCERSQCCHGAGVGPQPRGSNSKAVIPLVKSLLKRHLYPAEWSAVGTNPYTQSASHSNIGHTHCVKGYEVYPAVVGSHMLPGHIRCILRLAACRTNLPSPHPGTKNASPNRWTLPPDEAG